MSDNYIGTPWAIVRGHGQREIVSKKTRETICYVFAGSEPCTLAARIPRSKRIVACVNACEGINPEAVPDLLMALKRMVGSIAIQLDGHKKTCKCFICYARATIAKAEGAQ